VIYLTVPELIYIASRVLDGEVTVRDHGLLESATARPRVTVFGTDAYHTVEDKAAALLHSLVRNHALIDGNKRMALAATIAFLCLNGRRLTLSNNQAYELIIDVGSGEFRRASTCSVSGNLAGFVSGARSAGATCRAGRRVPRPEHLPDRDVERGAD
jgi:death-on-curing protein